jgi:hypothetical protein
VNDRISTAFTDRFRSCVFHLGYNALILNQG